MKKDNNLKKSSECADTTSKIILQQKY